MSRTTIKIKFIGQPDFVLDTMIDYPRKYIRHIFRANGETLDVTDLVSADDLNRSAVITDLRNTSRVGGPLIQIIVTPGADDVDGAGFGNGPEPSDATPTSTVAGGGAVVGVAATYSRADHVHPIAAGGVGTIELASASVTPLKLSVVDAGGIGSLFCLRKVLTSGGDTGTADDVSIYTANAPWKFRVVDAFLITSTAAAGSSTAALRTATGGAGTLLTGAMATDANGLSRPTGTTPTATATIAAAGSLALRRGDRAHAGELFVFGVREA